jgi:hypothetical protein
VKPQSSISQGTVETERKKKKKQLLQESIKMDQKHKKNTNKKENYKSSTLTYKVINT